MANLLPLGSRPVFFVILLVGIAACEPDGTSSSVSDLLTDTGGAQDAFFEVAQDTDATAAPDTAPACGDGIAQDDEACDGGDLRGESCEALGLGGGTLGCRFYCELDTSLCDVQSVCGDNRRDPDETCDLADLGGATCTGLGLGSGELACTSDCHIDASDCSSPPSCGNDKQEVDEACDGSDLAGQTCADLGFSKGQLACTSACLFQPSGCSDPIVCGDGLMFGTEACDLTDVGEQTCSSLGLQGGLLSCRDDCSLDTSGCDQACTSTCHVEGAQRCDGERSEICVTNTQGCGEWQLVEDCSVSSQVCWVDPVDGPVCADCDRGCPTVGALRCNGDRIQECSDDWACPQWTGLGNCKDFGGATQCTEVGGAHCDAGPSCDPDTFDGVCSSESAVYCSRRYRTPLRDDCGGSKPGFPAGTRVCLQCTQPNGAACVPANDQTCCEDGYVNSVCASSPGSSSGKASCGSTTSWYYQACGGPGTGKPEQTECAMDATNSWTCCRDPNAPVCDPITFTEICEGNVRVSCACGRELREDCSDDGLTCEESIDGFGAWCNPP